MIFYKKCHFFVLKTKKHVFSVFRRIPTQAKRPKTTENYTKKRQK